MAQALLNNLNTNITENTYSVDKTQATTADAAFDLILSSKTDNIETVNDYKKEAVNTQAEQNSQDSVNDSVTEIADNNVENLKNVILNNFTDDGDNVAAEEVTEENNETTITNEDPTQMNEKLKNALENPMTVIILQSQSNQKEQSNKNQEIDSESVEMQSQEPLISKDKLIKLQTEKTTAYDEIQVNSQKHTEQPKTLRDIVDESIIEELNIESVSSSSTQNEDSSNLMQYQTPQEQAVKVMLQSDVKFDDIKIDSVLSKTGLQTMSSPEKILEQVTKQMEGIYNTSKVDIVLNPETLGRVVLKIVNSKEGLAAQFTVTNQETQNALLKGIAGLKETLLSHGISVDNVVVKMNESELSQNDDKEQDLTEQNNSGGGNRRQGSGKQKKDEKFFEQTMIEYMNA